LDKVSAVKPIKLFTKVGCSYCHTPSYDLEKRTIYPYSDLLPHNLGEGKANPSRAKKGIYALKACY
jgi:CxxC motif-containing protein (DUF1111 family)